MTRDPARVEAELVALVRERSRADEAEVRAALSPLSSAEEKVLRRALRDTPAHTSLGPFAWADLARGVPLQVAQARELAGYYTLRAERDALAAMLHRGKSSPPSPNPSPPAEAAGEQRSLPQRAPVNSVHLQPRRGGGEGRRAEDLLGLFAYHRDAPLVARALGVSLSELTEELERLKIRRKAFSLTRGSDHDLPAAAPLARASSGPPVRRRPKGASSPAEPGVQREPQDESGVEEQARELKALLAEVGARRSLLAARLGPPGEPLSDAALVARFRAAGLEREFALRERDLIRGLWTKHLGSESRVAAELSTTPADLRRIVIERGLARELDGVRDRFRRDARQKKWPQERIEQVLHRRDELRELGVLEELDREVRARAAVIWKTLAGRRDALELLAKKLRLTREDAVRLQKLLDLR